MREAIDYRQRVDQCIVRAEAMADPTNRARWLQLAERPFLASCNFIVDQPHGASLPDCGGTVAGSPTRAGRLINVPPS